MSIEYLPVGIACNLKCSYCYQDPMRDAGNITTPKDWSEARKVLEKHNHKFTVFGGEPLLAPIEHLEEVFKFGLEKFGRNGIQTNGTLITEDHIDLFEKYKVGVGISIDGPGDLNSARLAGTSEETLEATKRIMEAIVALCRRGNTPSLITTLHRTNASNIEDLRTLCAWFTYLETFGVQHVNLHMLEVEKGKEALALTDEENIKAFEHIYEYSKDSKIRFQPFEDIRKLLTEEDPSVSCIWNHCDPLTTAAVQGVTADGTESNCGRTNKDGVNWIKGDKPGFERYLILRQTPQEYGGCKDCTYFIFCKGQCPGTAIDGDWRNRTAQCQVWFKLFHLIEVELLSTLRLPISRDLTKKKEIETKLVSRWEAGVGTTAGHGDSPHGDIPHGDEHGDAPHGDHHGDSGQRTEKSGVEVSWV